MESTKYIRGELRGRGAGSGKRVHALPLLGEEASTRAVCGATATGPKSLGWEENVKADVSCPRCAHWLMNHPDLEEVADAG